MCLELNNCQFKTSEYIYRSLYMKVKKSENVSHSVMSNFLNPRDSSLPGAFVQGILQARITEWVAISFSR